MFHYFCLKKFLQSGYYYFICGRKEIIYKISITMNELLKNLGVIVLLIGVIILAVPAINGGLSNSILLTGLGIIILGYIGHIVINKKLE